MLVERAIVYLDDESDLLSLRRAHNLLGVMHTHAADYQASLNHLQIALEYAHAMNDPLQVGPCLANAVLALKEMGHYHDAITVSLFIMRMDLAASYG